MGKKGSIGSEGEAGSGVAGVREEVQRERDLTLGCWSLT